MDKDNYLSILDKIKTIKTEDEFIYIDFKDYICCDKWLKAIIENNITVLYEYIDASKIKNKEQRKEIIDKYSNIQSYISSKYDNYEDKLSNIKKWLIFKIGNKLSYEYIHSIYDCDSLYKSIVDNYIKEWENEYVDCIFSMYNLFYNFISVFRKNHKRDFLNGYNGKGINWYFWLLNNLDTLYDIANDNEKETFDKFDELAKYTHSFGNYMPCPDKNYNRIKNSKYNDNIFELYTKNKFYRNWINKNKDKYYLDLLINSKIKDYNKSIKDYLDNCIEIIKKRSKVICNDYMHIHIIM